MVIAVPSKGRAGKVKTQKVLPSCSVYVPDLEVDAYCAAGTVNVVGVPNEVKGITQTRNWILRNTDDKRIVMVDDDVKHHGYIKFHEWDCKKRFITGDEWTNEFKKLFDVTEECKYRIWGVSTEGSRISIHTFKPFLWRSYVTASCMGIINNGATYFDESFPVKEDYELNLRCMKEDGGIVAARYLYWQNSHWGDDGGCKEYRTQGMEAKAIRRLQQMYPGMVRVTKRKNSEWCIGIC